MTDPRHAELVSRDVILKLLSDVESGRVSSAEATANLPEGAEYLDLDHTHAGILLFRSGEAPAMGTVVPRSAVSAATWQKIVAQVSTAKFE